MPDSCIWRPYTQEKTAAAAIKLARAEGSYLYTQNGRKIFDGVSSWWLITHGHCQPEIIEAVQKQAETIDQVLFANFSHEAAEELAQILVEITPPKLSHVFFSDNGSTAVEVSLKMALQACAQRGFESKTKFLAFDGAYHGDTVGAMSVGGPSVFTKPYRKTLFEVLIAKHPRNSSAIAEEFTQDFERLIKLNHNEIAAVIIEPLIQGAGGMIFWPEAAVQRVAKLCKLYDIYLIFDEVMTGFGRTGRAFAMDRVGITPDFLCLSKGLTGGMLPLAATLVSEDIHQAFLSESKERMFFHGHSFTGNPISCAAAVANIKLFQKSITIEKLSAIESAHQSSLKRLQKTIPARDVRICGTVGAFDLNEDMGNYLSNFSNQLTARTLEQGLFIRSLGSTIYLMPPYCSTQAEIEDCWSIVAEALL